jgi:Ca2+-binding EF-hand superfamily protein
VFNMFDANKDGCISYKEFIDAIRGTMTSERRALVEKVYAEIEESSAAKEVTLNELRNRFNPDNHPDIENRTKSVDQVTSEFMDSLESHHVLYVIEG